MPHIVVWVVIRMSFAYRDLRPGDVLTACDNVMAVPTGFLGHSAIAVSPNEIVEAVVTFPYVQRAPAAEFFKQHPKHAHYRPIPDWLAAGSAQYAAAYHRACQANYAKGLITPPFSFSPAIPLEDPWSSIYCSKLVWLCYYYGAGYPLYNDYFLFTPEDLDSVLGSDPNFALIYKHPDFHFKVDT